MAVNTRVYLSSFPLQSVTPTYSVLDSKFLTTELKMLMEEVAGLREETKAITCKCSDPNCPFNTEHECENEFELEEKQSPDLGFGSMEALNDHHKKRHGKNRYSLPLSLKLTPPPPTFKQRMNLSRNSTSLTNIPRGMQKRADGTILECDYPGSRRERKSGLTGGFSMSHLNRLDVYINEDMEEDCQVDQDGLTSHHDYLFSREAPERQILRNGRRESNKDLNAIKRDSNSIIGRSDSSSSTSSLKNRRVSDGITISRHSSADVILRHSDSVDCSDRLANFVRLKNFQMKRRSIFA